MQNNLLRLTATTNEGHYFINPEEIIRLEASSNYTNIITTAKQILTTRVLKSYEKILEPLGFVRTHRSHLVNLKYVLFIDGNGQIIMKDESKASISRRKKKDVMAEIRRSMAA